MKSEAPENMSYHYLRLVFISCIMIEYDKLHVV